MCCWWLCCCCFCDPDFHGWDAMKVGRRAMGLFTFAGWVLGALIGMFMVMVLFGCDTLSASLAIGWIVVMVVCMGCVGCLKGYRRGLESAIQSLEEATFAPLLWHKWTIVTYTIPNENESCLNRCLGEDKLKENFGCLVLPVHEPNRFVAQATRDAWLGSGLKKKYMIPKGDTDEYQYLREACDEADVDVPDAQDEPGSFGGACSPHGVVTVTAAAATTVQMGQTSGIEIEMSTQLLGQAEDGDTAGSAVAAAAEPEPTDFPLARKASYTSRAAAAVRSLSPRTSGQSSPRRTNMPLSSGADSDATAKDEDSGIINAMASWFSAPQKD